MARRKFSLIPRLLFLLSCFLTQTTVAVLFGLCGNIVRVTAKSEDGDFFSAD
jgi:hypothetical protein